MTDYTPRFVDALDSSKIRISFIMANLSDSEFYSGLFSNDFAFEVVDATHDLTTGLDCLKRELPQIVILDPKSDVDSVSHTIDLVIKGFAKRALIIDDRLREGLLAVILPFSQVSYLTRQESHNSLLDAVKRIALFGDRIFDSTVARRVRKTFRGWELELPGDQPSVATLTARELEVLKLLALGNSVRECARELHLSESTIDNHKTRLMKKLQVHKLTELTHIAIRDGLVPA